MGHVNITNIEIRGGMPWGMPMMPPRMHCGMGMPPIFMAPHPAVMAGAVIGGAAAAGAFSGVWQGIKNSGAYKFVAKGVNNFWNNYAKPVFNGIGNAIKFCWDNTLGRVFDWMGNLGKKK